MRGNYIKKNDGTICFLVVFVASFMLHETGPVLEPTPSFGLEETFDEFLANFQPIARDYYIEITDFASARTMESNFSEKLNKLMVLMKQSETKNAGLNFHAQYPDKEELKRVFHAYLETYGKNF